MDDNVAGIGLYIGAPLVRDENSNLGSPWPVVAACFPARPPANAHLQLRHVQGSSNFELPHAGILELKHVGESLEDVLV